MPAIFWLLVFFTFPLVLVMCLLVVGSSTTPTIQQVSIEPLAGDIELVEKLTVLVPFQNNQDTIRSSIAAIGVNAQSLPIQLILINNCSIDGSAEIAKNGVRQAGLQDTIFLTFPDRPSKAQALATALDCVASDLVVMVDSDVILENRALRDLVRFLNSTHSDMVSGFILYDSKTVESLAAWDKCLSHGTIRLGRYNLGLCPNVPGQIVLARRNAIEAYASFHSFLEDLAMSNAMYGKNMRIGFLQELVGRERYPTALGFLWKQRTRWLIGNLENLPRSVRSASSLKPREALGILLHLPIYHGFPILIPLWLLLFALGSWPSLGIACGLLILYAMAAWNGAYRTHSKGTAGSLLIFALVFPWLHLLAWVTAITICAVGPLLRLDMYSLPFFHKR